MPSNTERTNAQKAIDETPMADMGLTYAVLAVADQLERIADALEDQSGRGISAILGDFS